MRQDFFEFEPTHKIFIAANHKPVIRGTDEAIWRRIHLIPFTVTIPKSEQDKSLPQKLSRERCGILSWALRGCLEWQIKGLGVPEEVADATNTYRGEMDTIADFLGDSCIQEPRARVTIGKLYETYKQWCDENGEKALSRKRLSSLLKDRGFENRPRSDGRYEWIGIGEVSEHSGGEDTVSH